MGTKNNPSSYDCHRAADGDEPIFTLRAKDPLAAVLVRTWVELRREVDPTTRRGLNHTREAEKRLEALQCADLMEAWRKARFKD